MELVDLVTLGAIAHAELNAEVDAEPDKQNGEGDRNEVERTHQGQANCSGNGEADHQADGNRQDDPKRAQGKPKDGQHHHDGHGCVGERPLLQGGIFLIGDCDRTREA